VGPDRGDPQVALSFAPRVYAHRFGGHYGPELSLAALERSLSGQVDGLEADVVLTADDEIVVCHDPLLQISTAELSGWAHDHRAAALTSAHLRDDRGEPSDQTVLTLREALRAIPPGLPLQLDVKAYADPGLARRTAERCCEIAGEHGRAGQIEVISFFTPACEAAVAYGVGSRLIAWADYDPQALVGWAVERRIEGLSFEGFILDPKMRDAAREAELTISVGAVNTTAQLRMLLGLEPEIIVSDCPHALRGALDRSEESFAPPA
jgi:glycerophosphoryl diester phosphodiesterase